MAADRRWYRGNAWCAKTMATNLVVLLSTGLLVSLAACDASSRKQIVGEDKVKTEIFGIKPGLRRQLAPADRRQMAGGRRDQGHG